MRTYKCIPAHQRFISIYCAPRTNMGRNKTDKSKKRKRRHSQRSHSDSEDDDDDSSSTGSSTGSESESEEDGSATSGSASEESESESESSEEEEEERRSKLRKKARRSSESKKKTKRGRKEKERRRSKSSSSRKKEKRKKTVKSKKRETISMDDYYLKSAEFRTWLSKERGVFFSELTSEQSRKFFKKFVGKWNSGLLKKKYYRGIQSTAVGHDTQSKYQWKFAPEVNSSELKSIRDSVSTWTSNTLDDLVGRAGAAAAEKPLIGPQRPGTSTQIGPSIGPSVGPSYKSSSRSMDPFEREERREEERSRLKRERRDFRKHKEAVLEELVPKAGPGREARLEKKKMMAQKRREREISPEMTESTLMGPTADIKERIRNRQEERQNRAQAAAQKISDYQAKEKAKMAAILEMAKANKKEGAMW